MKRKYYLFLLFFLISSVAFSQNDLHINKIFEDYGKKEGSVLIELGKDILDNHTKINRYRSLLIVSDSVNVEIAKQIGQAIKSDFKANGSYGNGVILKEKFKDGILTEAIYSLGKPNNEKETEFIMFTYKSKQITLVYLKGKFEALQLKEELKSLEDLFIYVNKKRIKLN